LGGVETLIRSLQKEFFGKGEIVEFYSGVTKTVVGDARNVEYIQCQSSSKWKVLDRLFIKLTILKYLLKDAFAKKVVVIFHPMSLLYIPVFLSFNTKVILVQTNRFDVYFKGLGALVFRLFSWRLKCFVVYTKRDLESFVQLYPSIKVDLKVIPRGCKLVTSGITSPMSKKMVTIARIEEEQKNFDGMIDVMSELGAQYHLYIYGHGHDTEIDRLQEKIKNIENVSFMGVALNVSAVLKDYSLFLMTSHYEGFGQTLIEARSQGLPVVAYDTFDALESIVECGFNGFKVAPYNKVVFCEKIRAILSDSYNVFSANSLLKAKETEVEGVNEKWASIILN
jgi:Glycosyltransferase